MGYEVRVDCPACRIEGARLETWESEGARARIGLPESARCQFCAHAVVSRLERAGSDGTSVAEAAGDGCPDCGAGLEEEMRAARRCPFCGLSGTFDVTHPGVTFATAAEVDSALHRWALEESLDTSSDLLQAYFVLPDADALFDAHRRREAVETTFDLADYLFSSGSGAGGASGGEPAVMRSPNEERASLAKRTKSDAPPSVSTTQSMRRFGGPREELLALASVAAADGEAGPDDHAVLKRAAAKRNFPPLADEDVRVWRPNEVDPPATLNDRERVLEEMFQMAWSDGQMDESELRVIRDFSRAWGIDSKRLEEWIQLYSFADANGIQRWLSRLGYFLFPAR